MQGQTSHYQMQVAQNQANNFPTNLNSMPEAPVTARLETANAMLGEHIARLHEVLDKVRGTRPEAAAGVNGPVLTPNLSRGVEQYASLCGSLATVVNELAERI